MKTLGILSLLLTLAVSTVKNCNEEYYDGGDTTCTAKVEMFNQINAQGVATIYFTQGDELNIDIEGDKRSVENLNLQVYNGTLYISDKKNINGIAFQRLNLYITAPDLEKVWMNGVGSFTVNENLNLNHKLNFYSDGVGSVNINSVSCDNAEFYNNGVGSFTINHCECGDIKIEQGGVGNFKIDLNAKDIRLNSTGVGSVTLNTQCRKIDISSSGIGSTTVTGTADDYTVVKSGIGSVNVNGLNRAK